MARVFVSHAGEDLALAREVHGWLTEVGHEVFLDRDLRAGIAVGEQWRQRLRERLRWADAVVCVLTSAAVASSWCTAEIAIAQSRGSRLLPLRAEPDVDHPLLADVQYTDLTADPAAARAELIATLRRIDAAGGAGWSDERSPYPGLRSFDVDRHRVFFGRAEEIKVLAELVRSAGEAAPGAEGAVLLVVGPSGCGKSSLVRAGLVPVLADEPGWRILSPLLPGADPLTVLARELAVAARRIELDWTVEQVGRRLAAGELTRLADELLLADPGGPQRRLLIVLDQFEELLTQTPPTLRARFVELLRPALTGPVRVVGTLRPEFLDQLLADPAVAGLATDIHPLRPLQREALRLVIEGPARLAGIDIDEHLVARLVDDTDGGEALPLLAFTLAQLADGITRGGRLSSARYDQLGGVRGALTRQADAAGSRSRAQVISGLLRLVTVDEQGRPTRWRVRRDELPEAVVTALDAFVTRRLLITDTEDGTVVIGVAHEAFLSTWPPLVEAIAQNVSGLRARRAVEHAATEWVDHGRPRERLWGGGQLAAAVNDTERIDLGPDALDFLHASGRRDRFRRRRAVTVLSVLLILALVAAGVAVVLQRMAQEQQQIATARQLIAQAEAIRSTDPRTALRLAVAAEHIRPGGEARAGLVNTLTTNRYLGAFTGHGGAVYAVAFNPDGSILATGSLDRTVRLWDASDPAAPRQLGPPLTGHAGTVRSVVFGRDGTTLATAGDEGVLLWDLTDPATPRPLGPALTGHLGPVDFVAFTPDGTTLATASLDGTAILWDVRDPAAPRQLGPTLISPTGSVNLVAFAPDGTTLATARNDSTVVLWKVTDPALPRSFGPPLTGDAGLVSAVAFGRSGTTLATANADQATILWEVSDPAAPRRLGQPLPGHDGSVSSVAFGPDGTTLASASLVGPTFLWDLTDPGTPRRLGPPLTGHDGPVNSVAFGHDSEILASGGDDGVILWDLTDPDAPRPLGPPLTGHTGPVHSVAFDPDGTTLATGGYDGAVHLWDLTDPTRPRRLGPALTGEATSLNSVAFGPDGSVLASAGDDGAVILWDLTELNDLRDHAVEQACAITNGGLDQAEWTRYLPALPYQDTCPS